MLKSCFPGGVSAVVTVTVDGQTTQGSLETSIRYSGPTVMVSALCRSERTGECFDCCQGKEMCTQHIRVFTMYAGILLVLTFSVFSAVFHNFFLSKPGKDC